MKDADELGTGMRDGGTCGGERGVEARRIDAEIDDDEVRMAGHAQSGAWLRTRDLSGLPSQAVLGPSIRTRSVFAPR